MALHEQKFEIGSTEQASRGAAVAEVSPCAGYRNRSSADLRDRRTVIDGQIRDTAFGYMKNARSFKRLTEINCCLSCHDSALVCPSVAENTEYSLPMLTDSLDAHASSPTIPARPGTQDSLRLSLNPKFSGSTVCFLTMRAGRDFGMGGGRQETHAMWSGGNWSGAKGEMKSHAAV